MPRGSLHGDSRNRRAENAQLETLLASGAVTVFANPTAEDIVVAVPVAWSGTASLTIEASRSVRIDRPITVAGTAGVSLLWDAVSSGLSFGKSGKVSFASVSSALSTNNGSATTTWTLEDSIAALAAAIGNNPSGNFALSADYDASADGTYSASPIGAELNQGNVWGFGNTIFNLKVDDPVAGHSVGLFKSVGPQSTVAYLNLARINIHGADSWSSGTAEEVGGLAAQIRQATIFADTVAGTVVGGSGSSVSVGGLAGVALQDSISESHFDGTVKGGSGGSSKGLPHGPVVGGLFGVSQDGVIDQTYAEGSVRGRRNSVVGGLVAVSDTFFGTSTIGNSLSTSAVTSGTGGWAGGLVGSNGGIGGANEPCAVDESYSTGLVTGTTMGGLIGVDGSKSGSLMHTYWYLSTSGVTTASQGAGNISNDPGITGLTAAQLQSGLPAGFAPKIWAEKSAIAGGLPYLRALPPPK